MPTAPSTYTVKPGDTLNGIASSLGYADYKAANISGFGADPNKIQVGQQLTVGGGPKTTEVPGLGTITTTPKNLPNAGTPPAGSEDLSGAYKRYGVNPPPTDVPNTPNGYQPPSVAGLPQYPSGTPQANITDAYKTTLDTIKGLESRISSSAAASPEEQTLTKQLNDAKAKLASYDVGTLSAEEALHGQGRGATLGTIDTRTTVLDRTRALERLGFATDASTIATQLSTAQANRQDQGNVAKTEYDLATKKLDIALGIQEKLTSLDEKQKADARQYLLDVVNFGDGKTYDQLTPDTQAAITHAVANSPITLDMVKTALSTGAQNAAAKKIGDLRSVAGVGVVRINPDGTYKVVVPENVSDHTSSSSTAPSFNDYIAQQNIPLPLLTPEKQAQLKAEYDATYGTTVSLGKLTPTQKGTLAQANLSGAPTPVQSYFLNSPPEFQNQYQRDFAAGLVKGSPTIATMTTAYQKWYDANKNKNSTDWASILKNASAK
jgi:LysM repeat protein